jgi:hypothetical protein
MKKREIKKLDARWSKKVRSKGHCEACLRNDELVKLEAAHIVGRIRRTTRWGVWITVDGKNYYDSNGVCLCHACHRAFDEHLPTEKFIREVVIGIDRYNALLATKNTVAKYQDSDQIAEWIDKMGGEDEDDQ